MRRLDVAERQEAIRASVWKRWTTAAAVAFTTLGLSCLQHELIDGAGPSRGPGHVSEVPKTYVLLVDKSFPTEPDEALRLEVAFGDGTWIRLASITPNAARELSRIWYDRPEPSRRYGYRNRRRAARLGRAWSRTAKTVETAQVTTLAELNPDRLAQVVRGLRDLPPGWWRLPRQDQYDSAKVPGRRFAGGGVEPPRRSSDRSSSE